MTKLSADEIADFWALGISLEAEHVPDDEWRRAARAARRQAHQRLVRTQLLRFIVRLARGQRQ